MKHLSVIRAVVQLSAWLAFIIIILASRDTTDNTFLSFIPGLSPYLGITVSIAVRFLAAVFIPGLILLILGLVLGRFFCGWLCPLGATIDCTDRLTVPETFSIKTPGIKKPALKSVKYIILFITTVLSIAGIQISGIFDPISVSVRTYGTVIFSYLDTGLKIIFNALYYVPVINTVSEPVYSLLKEHLLDFNQVQYNNHIPVFLFFLTIILLSVFARRFWCRAICPLGALYALSGKIALLRRIVDKDKCTGCLACEKKCRMGAIYNDGISTCEEECIRCLDCMKTCKYDAVRFSFLSPFKRKKTAPEKDNSSIKFTRKRIVGTFLSSIIAIPLLKHRTGYKRDYSGLIRPPGALKEPDFLNTCVRCGQCMKVCPTNALHPLLFEYGIAAAFTPQLIPRLGWCEKNCSQCTQVCPSGALKKVSIPEKETTIIGTAYFVKELCIPWSEHKNCLVCEEMCPTKKKSIIFRDDYVADKYGRRKKVKLPFVVEETCTGCGICENKCPVPGNAAIRIRSPKKVSAESDRGDPYK